MKDDVYKIFFASYDEEGKGRIFYLIIDLNQPTNILEMETNPVINIGHIGFYDDNGIIPSSVLKVEKQVNLYTIGFSIKNKLLFDASSGLAISKDNGITFHKYDGPIIEKSIYDPCFAASPVVVYDNGIYKMWYVSCLRWEKQENGYKHYYNIRYKQSIDGVHWNCESEIAIDFKNKFEYAISRPSVIIESEHRYKMWYSFRAQKNIATYRIGYAESKDGKSWVRKDEEAGIDVSKTGWDSEMICYPYVFDHKGSRYMLYNGNGYGKTGFGLAILEQD
ncbi:MAG: hypothetical protein GY797_18915 [Deltaproteobacteria bacterium]|nr:hypothetical protein [Deltaproteobacteria bacterium]